MIECNEVVNQHYRKNYNRLVSQSISRVGVDNAPDAVQEAYARALRYWTSFDPKQGLFDEWFHQVWLNACKSVGIFYSTGRGTEVAEESRTMPPAAPSAVELSRIATLLADEPDDRRRIIELRLIKGFTDTEICDILPVSKANIRKVVERFRKKL